MKFETSAERGCGITGYRIISFEETSVSAGRPVAYGGAAPASNSGSLEFDAIWINKLLNVNFLVDSEKCESTEWRGATVVANTHGIGL